MRLPNFLIIGAAKSGTSSLWYYLQQHSEIYLTNPKEPNFFVFEGLSLPPDSGPADAEILYQRLYRNSVTDYQSYLSLFTDGTREKAVGEASVRYLYYPDCPEKVKQYIPDVKMIVLLRHPLTRLYSHYIMNIRHLLEPLGLAEAIAAEPERIKQNWGYDWHYMAVSSYFSQIDHYLHFFAPEQLKIIIYEELLQQPLTIIQEVYRYLEVDDTFVPDISKNKNQGSFPKSFLLHRLLNTDNQIKSTLKQLLPSNLYWQMIKSAKKSNKGKIPPLPQDVIPIVKPQLQEELEQLQELLGRKLPWTFDFT